MNSKLEQLAFLIRESREFVIVGHRNPDGDCLGTMGAFYCLFNSLDKGSTLLVSDELPENYLFLPGMTDIEVVESFDCGGKPVLLLECGTVDRSGIRLANMGTTINLDHHPDNTLYADFNIVNPSASSVGEMVTLFFSNFFSEQLTTQVAASLFTAIHTDTGGFSYSNVSEQTLQASASLVSKGIDIGAICARVYQENRLERYYLMGFFLSRIYTAGDGSFGVGILKLEDLRRFQCTGLDTDNFSALTRGIKGVEVGMFLLEITPGVFKVSLRSKGRMNVNRATAIRGGGGHANAAGVVIKGEATDIVKDLIELIRETNEESNISN